jgi:spore coat protein U-like protein
MLLTASAQSSFAGSASGGSINYQVVLQESCAVIVSAGSGPLDLGSYPSYDGDVTVPIAGSVTVLCSNNLAYGICVSGGTYYTASTRRMKDTATPPNYLNYDLQNAADSASVGDKNCDSFASIGADTAAWADPIGGPVPGLTATAGNQPFDLKAVVTVPADSPPGSYSDNGVQLMVVW